MAGRAAFCCHLIDRNTHGRLGHGEWRSAVQGSIFAFLLIYPGYLLLHHTSSLSFGAVLIYGTEPPLVVLPDDLSGDPPQYKSRHTHTYIRDGRKLVLEWLSLSLLFSFKVVVMAWFFSSRRKPLRKPLRKPTSILASLWIKTARV